jgi:hypothetical protein
MERFADRARDLENCRYVPPLVRIVAFDTADEVQALAHYLSDGRTVNLERDQEFLHCRYKVPEVVRGLHYFPQVARWFPRDEMEVLSRQIMDVNQGAPGRMRKFGRLAMFLKRDTILAWILQAAMSVKEPGNIHNAETLGFDVPDGTTGVDFYLVASLCGGTGSGMFLDLAYLLRYHLATLGQRMSNGYYAFLVLPDAFGGMPEVDRAGVRANAYAALKELDHYMNDNPFSCDYGGGVALDKVVGKPVTMCYLMDGAAEDGSYRLRDVNYVAKIVAEAVYIHMSNPVNVAGQSVLTASGQYLGQDVRGRCSAYSSLGMATRFVPHERLLEYCTSRLSAELTDLVLDPEQMAHQPDPAAAQAAQERWQERITGAKAAFLTSNEADLVALSGRLQADAQGGKVIGEPFSVLSYRFQPPRQQADQLEVARKGADADLIPQLAEVIQANERVLIRKIGEALQQTVKDQLDDRSRGPKFALEFLESLRKSYVEWEKEAEREEEKFRPLRGTAGNNVGIAIADLRRYVQSTIRTTFRRGKCRSLLENCVQALNEYTRIHLEVARWAALRRILVTLRGEAMGGGEGTLGIRQLKGRCNRLMTQLDALRQRLEVSKSGSRPQQDKATVIFERPLFQTEGEYERIYVRHVLPDSEEEWPRPPVQRVTYLRGLQQRLEEFFALSSVSALSYWADIPEREILRQLREYAQVVFAPLEAISVERAVEIKREWGEEIAPREVFQALDEGAVPWLPYVEAELMAFNLPYSIKMLGVGDPGQSEIWDAAQGVAGIGHATTRDMRSVLLFNTKHGFTAASLSCMEDMSLHYDHALDPELRRDRRPLHLDTESEYLEEPVPDRTPLRDFALAMGLGLVKEGTRDGKRCVYLDAGEQVWLAEGTGPEGLAESLRKLRASPDNLELAQRAVTQRLTGEHEPENLRLLTDYAKGLSELPSQTVFQRRVAEEILHYISGD